METSTFENREHFFRVHHYEKKCEGQTREYPRDQYGDKFLFSLFINKSIPHNLIEKFPIVPVESINPAISKFEISVGDAIGFFQTEFQLIELDSVEYRIHSDLYLPVEFKEYVSAIMGVNNYPIVRLPKSLTGNFSGFFKAKYNKSASKLSTVSSAIPFTISGPELTAPEWAALYNYPTNVTGSGVKIAVVSYGNLGYLPSDINFYATFLGLNIPNITVVSVNGGTNTVLNLEIPLNLEIVSTVANDSIIRLYIAPDSSFQSVYDNYYQLINDGNDVATSSFGFFQVQFLDPVLYMEWRKLMVTSVEKRVTMFNASGNDGAYEAFTPFPTLDLCVTAVGGTEVTVDEFGQIVSEIGWSGSGGGAVLGVPVPPFQYLNGIFPVNCVNPAFRGFGRPDVAAGYAFYVVFIGGQFVNLAGTSASGPLWAGLLALIDEYTKSTKGVTVGYLNPYLYNGKGTGLNDITIGSNGCYSCAPGWDAVTGWGSPNGVALMNYLESIVQLY